jgi:hypothetical protein
MRVNILNADWSYFYDGDIWTSKELKNEYIEFLKGYIGSDFGDMSFNYWLQGEVRAFPLVKLGDNLYVNKRDNSLVNEIKDILLASNEGYDNLMEQISEYDTYIDKEDYEHIVFHVIHNDTYVIE